MNPVEEINNQHQNSEPGMSGDQNDVVQARSNSGSGQSSEEPGQDTAGNNVSDDNYSNSDG